ncbi:MAG: serine/threonine-protein phosphatase, partial [Caldilineaceae bacterium]|nr:serine/threonine-protein phosphatase [Caldilineaceae bacterium]
HAPVIYRPAQGSAHLLEADAPPLGVIDFNLACAHVLPFAVGDLLVVTTDGFNEAERSDGTMLGYERLLAAVDELADADIEEIAKQLFALAHSFTEGHIQSDDQTLLVLKRIEADVL